MIMRKSNLFLLVLLITLTVQLGCGKNALFHSKVARSPKISKVNNVRYITDYNPDTGPCFYSSFRNL